MTLPKAGLGPNYEAGKVYLGAVQLPHVMLVFPSQLCVLTLSFKYFFKFLSPSQIKNKLIKLKNIYLVKETHQHPVFILTLDTCILTFLSLDMEFRALFSLKYS